MDTNKQKMFYMMHVNWDWIKQRPHFIAENLKQHFNILVFYPKSYLNKKQLQKNKKPNFVKSFKTLPLQRFRENRLYSFINNLFITIQLKNIISKSDYIWITAPNYYHFVRKYLKPTQIVIYDCMDDFLEFPTIKLNKKLLNIYKLNEQELLKRSNFVFTSSEYLKSKLENRYSNIENLNIVGINNAISSTFFEQNKILKEISYPVKNGKIDLMYIGTISHWFDFELILQSLEEFNQIRYILIGPTERSIPVHDRIIHLGTQNHEDLNSYMQNADALIMPFVVNNLIKSVNPVKLYEYIFTGKPIITCNYTEIRQFDQFVFNYNTNYEYFELVNRLLNNDLIQKDIDLCHEFLKNNQWKNRVAKIIELVKKINTI